MTCDDENLRQLRDLTHSRLDTDTVEIYSGTLKALVARLSAGEAYILTIRHSNDGADIRAAELFWRKAAGK